MSSVQNPSWLMIKGDYTNYMVDDHNPWFSTNHYAPSSVQFVAPEDRLCSRFAAAAIPYLQKLGPWWQGLALSAEG